MHQGTLVLDPIIRPSSRTRSVRTATRLPAAVVEFVERPSPIRRVAYTPPPQQPPHERIARVAYDIWLERGRPVGQDLSHWFAAEALLRSMQRAAYPRPSL